MAILGIDEVGRGPLAGPLVIGAVILPEGDFKWKSQLTDSKKLTAKKRTELNEIILQKSLAHSLGWVSAGELDEIGLSEALRLATKRAVQDIQKQKVPFSEIIIDGTVNFLSGTKLEKYTTTLKKADLLIKEVSAASIIAKVARDNYMIKLAEKYPEYGFEKHVGYGTKYHCVAIKNYGPCSEHRYSFNKVGNVADSSCGRSSLPSSRGSSLRPRSNCGCPQELSSTSSTSKGNLAEDVVASYLESQGHEIIARNHKTKFYEIDIISAKDDKIYFTEVKYRKSFGRGEPLENVTKKKQQQMRFAAESYLKFNKNFQNYNPLLAVAAVSGEDFLIDDWFVLGD